MNLRQSTAKTFRVGPFLDEDDGKTAEVGLAIAQADIRLSKSGGAFAQSNDAGGAAHDESGWYSLQLNGTDTDTLGPLQLAIHEAGALPVFVDFMVLPANVYDSMYSTDKLEVDVVQLGGVAQSATDLKDFADAGYDPGTNKVQGVVLTDTVTTLTGHTAQTGDNYARLGAPAGVSVSADIAAVKSDTAAILVDTAEIGTAGAGLSDLGGMSTGMKGEVNAEADQALVDINLDHLLSSSGSGVDVGDDSLIAQMVAKGILADWDTFDNQTDSLEAIADSVSGTPLTAQETRDAMKLAPTGGVPAAGSVDLHLDDILADTAEIGTAGAGLTDLGGMSTGMKAEVEAEATDALNAYDGPTDAEMIARTLTAASYATAAALATHDGKLDTVDGIVDNILVDTAEIGTAGAGLTDLGGMSTGMKAEVLAEASDAIDAYDPPTDAEMAARTIPSADYFDPTVDAVAVVTEVSQLGAQAKADVNAEVDTALTDYDGPTHAELKTELMEKGFDQDVLTRHANNKPKTFHVGSGADRMKVTTVQDASGDTETQTYAADPA